MPDDEEGRSSWQSSISEADRAGNQPERWGTVLEIAAVAVFLAATTIFAIITPPGSAPDEDGHAVYARAVSHGRLPAPAPLTEVRIEADGRVVYDCAQAHHPPLYYALVGGLYALTGRHPALLTPIGRILNILAGLAALLLMRAAMHRAFPGRALAIAAGLTLAVASPTFTYVMGSFNNDPLAVVAVCASIYLAVRALQSPRPARWLPALGAVLGAGLLAKLTAAVIVLPLLIAGLGVARREAQDQRRRALRGTAAALGIAAAMVAPWFVRNYLLVGAPTFNCAARPPLFGSISEVIWQPEATVLAIGLGMEEAIAGAWWPEWLLRDHHTLVADVFVGGGVTAKTRPAWMVLLPMLIGGIGLVGILRQLYAEKWEFDLAQRHILWVMILIPVMTGAGIMHQALLVDGHIMRWAGRYVSVMIPSLGMVVALGVAGLLSERRRVALPILTIAAAVGLNGWAVFRIARLYAGWTGGA